MTEGIENLSQTDIFHAKNFGYKIKLLAIAEIKNNDNYTAAELKV